MASASTTNAAAAPVDPEQREYNLISQLELRIASASTDEKLEAILQKFLPALLLKLASPTERNRNLTIKVSQYLNQRLKINQNIKLPVSALVKTFREAENAFVRRFCLIFIEQGLPRLEAQQAIEALPGFLQFAIPKAEGYDNTDRKMWAIAFDFLLEVLSKWKLPDRHSKEDLALQATFSLSDFQTNLLVRRICDFLLYDPKDASTVQSLDEDFRPVMDKNFRRRSQVVLPIAKFLFTSIFSDQQRLLPAVIMAVDANASAINMSDIFFKQTEFDLEAESNVDELFALYRRSKPKLQTKILSLLSRSQTSTSRTTEIMAMIESQLNTTNAGLEAAKLRTALFSYLTWTVRVGNTLGQISHRVQDLLKEYIEMQGWPSMNDRSAAETELRAKAYESIGLLAAAKESKATGSGPGTPKSESGHRTLDLITWLFTSLRCDTTRDIKGSIEEAIGRVMNTITQLDDTSTQRLKDLLLWNVLAVPGDEDPVYFFPTVNTTKYPAVRFVNKVLPFHDVDARFINVLALASSDRREVAEEGVRGLDPYWHASNLRMVNASSQNQKLALPDLEKLVTRFFVTTDDTNANQKKILTEPHVLAAAVMFCRNVLVCDALKDTSLAPEESADWRQRIDALVNNDQEVRVKIRTHLQSLQPEMQVILVQAALMGLSKGSLDCGDFCFELLSLSPNDLLPLVAEAGLQAASLVVSNAAVQSRAARIYGILASLRDDADVLINLGLDKCSAWRNAIGEEVHRVRGYLLQAVFTLTRRSLRGLAVEATTLTSTFKLVCDVIRTSTDKSLKETGFRCLRQLASCTPDIKDMLVEAAIFSQLVSESKKESEPAASAIGPVFALLSQGNTQDDVQEGAGTTDSKTPTMLDRILGLYEVKRAEFHFALGESLAVALAGFKSTSTITEFDVDAQRPEWGFREDLMTDVLSRVIEDSRTTRPSQKKAAAIWLLCLIQYCGDAEPIKSRLRDAQAAFARLLSDRDEIVQETGSRGLSVVYEHGDKSLRDDLVRDLVSSFTGNKAKMSGTVNEDTELFDAGALPTEGGQSVTTYKDIVNLATEMGDPSLVYRFMNLASNNAIWTSRAAFGRFGLGNVLADSTYLAENKKFYPKLFRYRFDPNPNVQRSMNEIWKALVKDPNAVIGENFDLIMDDLLKSVLSGKEWRVREASCAAISDLVQGRDLDLFQKYLDEIWKVSFKVLDDVKESVRLAAMKLCRTLTSMLIRNLETDGNTKRSRTMLNHAMPFLLQQMDGGAGKDVQQYAIVTLLEVVKKCPSRALQPFAPQVLEALVVSLSSLEHESINYLHLNADKYGLTAEKLDKMRVSSINASPVTEAMERCLESITMPNDESVDGADAMEGVVVNGQGSNPVMDDAMQRLSNAYRAAIGLPSKVGLSRVMTTLVIRHQAAFGPYADKFIQLTRKHILDRNATISVAFSTSLGYLMRLGSQKEIQATSKYAQKLYFESEELMHRSVAGEIIQAISKAANDVFMNSASTFLPFAFIGRRDTDKEVRERFDVPWKDNIGGSRAINLYLKEIVELISTHIKSPLWPIKHACCFAVAELIKTMEVTERYSPGEALLLWDLMQASLDGKTWEGKEEVIEVYPKFVRQAGSLREDVKVTQQMKKVALREAKRTNAGYRPHAIKALGEFVMARKDIDMTDEVVPYLVELMDELTDKDAMDIDESGGKGFDKRSIVEDTISAIVSCLFQQLTAQTRREVLDAALEIVGKARRLRTSEIDRATYEGAKILMEKQRPEGRRVDGFRRDTKGGDVEKTLGNAADAASASALGSGAGENGSAEGGEGPQSAREGIASEPRAVALALALAALGSGDSASIDRQASEPEHLRKSRVSLALAVAQNCGQRSDTLARMLDGWYESERSRPLREEIDRVRQANDRSG
ncbi:hypothetical protein PV10_03010 [Exophiala mesophila]|uniref:Proteasome component ECM29 n=1 Tax=Exophiala mesophila TaxID=212818 RepID=A0A0D2A8N6_EXOME|nr:uncharacterized protein PV10_03010 [Exophiala mesophila]KIV95343.1 hypothetical protein PV10_03010 [Exophiala mesophila]